MGTEIAKPAMGRDQMLSLMKPVKEQFSPQEEAQNAALVSFELNIVSLKVSRFGWEQMDKGFKQRLSDDWTDVLRHFPIAEVRRGIGDCLTANERTCPTEQAVRAAIMARRAKAIARTPKPIPQQEPPSEVSAKDKERRAAVSAEMMARFKSDRSEA